MVGKVIAVILIVGLCIFICYEVFGIVRALVRRKNKKDKQVISDKEITSDKKHGESE